MRKIIAVMGPTASGKSDLAVRIAREIGAGHLGGNGAEIVSADSRQVYKGMDIGTGKITPEEMAGIPHHLLDVITPTERFSVVRWREMAERAVNEIIGRGNVPIVCGGTGYYISALVDGLRFPELESDPEERRALEARTSESLFSELKGLDPLRATSMEHYGENQNNRRLARAILIARSDLERELPRSDLGKTLKIGILIRDEDLKERIRDRLVKRMGNGMIGEAERLRRQGLDLARMDELGLEYRYLAKYLRGELSKDQLIETLATKIWQYARRQKTWFKRDKDIRWFAPDDWSGIEKAVRDFLSDNDSTGTTSSDKSPE